MAQINITLNQEEFLALLKKGDENQFMTKLLEKGLNEILKAQSEAQLQAKRYDRTEDRTDYRNGYRERALTTRLGKITLHVPRHRFKAFETEIFEKYSRSESALIASMAEMVVNGVSTRKIAKVMETLCGETISKSAVSRICQRLSADVITFQNRQLTSSYPFLTVDATYFKVREHGRIISKAMFIAYGTNEHGHRDIIGFKPYSRESAATWSDFFQYLKKRGLRGVKMVTSDAHGGILNALVKELPDVPWQRCQFHFSINITEKAPKKYQAGLRAELNEMFNCRTIEQAHKKRDEIIEEYGDIAESAMKALDEGFESAMTVMILPFGLRKYFRTSNHIERLNRELKRRSKVIGVFPNEDSLLRLIGSVLLEINEHNPQRRAIFSEKTLHEALEPERLIKLRQAAIEQQNLLAA